jgi:hypothetical protein
MDEAWIHKYDAETKQQSQELRESFPTSNEVQDTEDLKQDVGVSSRAKMKFCL